jgi:flagellar biosynthesis protein FlhB
MGDDTDAKKVKKSGKKSSVDIVAELDMARRVLEAATMEPELDEDVELVEEEE